MKDNYCDVSNINRAISRSWTHGVDRNPGRAAVSAWETVPGVTIVFPDETRPFSIKGCVSQMTHFLFQVKEEDGVLESRHFE